MNDTRRLDRRTFLRICRNAGTALAGGAAFSTWGCSNAVPFGVIDADQVPRAGGLDVTFFVAADTHFGWRDGDRTNAPLLRGLVDTMNALPGTSLPGGLEGVVAEPERVVVAGDLTEDGYIDEFLAYADHFGHTGKEGILRHRVLETVGNHDFHSGDKVALLVETRQGRTHYTRDFGDLRVVCLGDGPDDEVLTWFRRVLAETGRERPILVFLHYPLAGPYSNTNGFGQGFGRWHLVRSLQGFNVLGVFHGHFHASGAYRFCGIDVYNVGASKHGSNSFAVVRVTDTELMVASWNWLHQRWWWSHRKPINAARPEASPTVPRLFGAGPGEHLETYPMPQGQRPALIRPYPQTARRT